MSERYDKVLKFIMQKHQNQYDEGGNPYVLHPITVALMCNNESEKIVALLHDILEKTDTKEEDLKTLKLLNSSELRAIKALTRKKDMSYKDYIRRLFYYPLAIKVKKAELLHNMDLSRLSVVTEKDLERNKKYQKAYDFLNSIEFFYGSIRRDL